MPLTPKDLTPTDTSYLLAFFTAYSKLDSPSTQIHHRVANLLRLENPRSAADKYTRLKGRIHGGRGGGGGGRRGGGGDIGSGSSGDESRKRTRPQEKKARKKVHTAAAEEDGAVEVVLPEVTIEEEARALGVDEGWGEGSKSDSDTVDEDWLSTPPTSDIEDNADGGNDATAKETQVVKKEEPAEPEVWAWD